MNYDLSRYKIDIGGPDGNVFFLLGKVTKAVQQIGGQEEAEKFRARCIGKAMDKLGFNWDYEDVIRTIVEETGIQFVSEHELSLPEELYTIERREFL